MSSLASEGMASLRSRFAPEVCRREKGHKHDVHGFCRSRLVLGQEGLFDHLLLALRGKAVPRAHCDCHAGVPLLGVLAMRWMPSLLLGRETT